MSEPPIAVLGLDGEYPEAELPLLIQRRGMATWDDGVVRILDRRRLPHERAWIDCRSVEDVALAIESMTIQGAFTISIAAGYGLALAVDETVESARNRAMLRVAARRLERTRPTGLALRRVVRAALDAAESALDGGRDPREAVVTTVDDAAQALARQALLTGRHANELIPDGTAILTHCFADRALLYLLLEARRIGKKLEVYSSETRPYLQGARLTTASVLEVGYPVTLITDGMGGFLFRSGVVNALVTAADRVCLDGTICNKVGTYQFALAAKANGCPYFVLRQSGPDRESATEADVQIEYRDPASVLTFEGRSLTPHGVRGLYPAFDITPPELVTAIVTDRGVFRPSDVGAYFDADATVAGTIA